MNWLSAPYIAFEPPILCHATPHVGASDPRRCEPNYHTCCGEFGGEFHDAVVGHVGFLPPLWGGAVTSRVSETD